METVLAATITGAFTLAGAWFTIRRPMRREHNSAVDQRERAIEMIASTYDHVRDNGKEIRHVKERVTTVEGAVRKHLEEDHANNS